MRKSTRLIALLMTFMMLIGMMPFSMYAVPSSEDHDHDHSGDGYTGESVASSDYEGVKAKVEALGATLRQFDNFESALGSNETYKKLNLSTYGTIANAPVGAVAYKNFTGGIGLERVDSNVALKYSFSTDNYEHADIEKSGKDVFLTENLNFSGQNFVFSFDLKNTAAAGQGLTLLLGARYGGFRTIDMITVMPNNEIRTGSATGSIIGYVNAETFTTVAIEGDIVNNKLYIYLNGALASERILFTDSFLATCTANNGANGAVTKDNVKLEAFRMFSAWSQSYAKDGGLYVDNMFLYTKAATQGDLKYIDEDTTVRNGFVEANDRVYYLKNNTRMAPATYTFDGVEYYFNNKGEVLKASRTSLVDFEKALGGKNPNGLIFKEGNGLYAIKSVSRSNVQFSAGNGLNSVTLADFLEASYVEWNVYTDGVQKNTVFPLYFNFKDTYTYDPADTSKAKKPLNVNKVLNFDSQSIVAYDSNKSGESVTFGNPLGIDGWSVIKTTSTSGAFDDTRLNKWTLVNLKNEGKTTADVLLDTIQFKIGEGWGVGNGLTYLTAICDATGKEVVNVDYTVYFSSINLVKYNTPATSVEDMGMTGWVTMVDGTKYYFPTWSHKLANNVTLDVDGKGYVFGKDGKLVGEANGIHTVQYGKVHYYKNGVMQVGDKNFKYTDGDKSYAINGNGDYLGNYYEYYSAKNYSDITRKYERTNYLKAIDFNSLTLGKKFANNADGTGFAHPNSWLNGKSYLGTGLSGNIKNTYSEIVKDADGDNALLWSNQHTNNDPYLEFYLGSETKYTNVAISVDVKLGEDWANTLQLINPISREDTSVFVDALRINADGYLVYKNSTKILAKLSAAEYTNVTMVLRTNDTKLNVDVYVNGAKLVNDDLIYSGSNKFSYVNEIRFARFDKSAYTGHLYLDDIYVYALTEGETPDNVSDWTYTGGTGLTNVNGVNYFFDANGAAIVGSQTIGGAYYLFDAETGAGVQGVNAGRYYNNGKRDDESVGLVEKAEGYYYFNADHTVLINGSIFNGLSRYVADKNGIVTTEFVNAGDVLFNAGEMKNNNSAGALKYNSGSEVLYSTYAKNSFIVKNGSKIDLSSYDALRVKMYIPEAFTDSKIMFIFEREDLLYKLSGNPAEGTVTVSADAVYKSEAMKNSTAYQDKGWQTVNEKSTRLVTITRADGTVDYYKRDYTYYNPTVKTQLKDLGSGWVTLDLPLAGYELSGDKGPMTLANIAQICFIPAWGSSESPVCYVSAADQNKVIEFESISAVSYGEKDETANGVVGDYLYKDGIPQTGWQNVGGDFYYLDPVTGKKTTGIKYIPTKRPTSGAIAPAAASDDGLYYDFGDSGICNGVVNGVREVVIPVVNGSKVESKTVSRLFQSGDVASGFTTNEIDGKTYYADPETGALVKDSTIKIGDTYYTFDENGAANELNGWYVDSATGDTFYNDPINGLASGLTVIKVDGVDYYYYFDPTTNALKKNFWSPDGMYFGADGKAANGMVDNVNVGGIVESKMHFTDGIPSAGTVDENKVRYVFGEDGKLISQINLTAAEVVITIKKDGTTEVLRFKTTMGASFTYQVPNYLDYEVQAYDSAYNTIAAVDGVITITVDEVTGYTEFTVVYNDSSVAHDFVYKAELSTPATCMRDGFDIYVCSACGKVDKRTVLKDTTNGHKFNEFNGTYCTDADCDHRNGCWAIARAASCTADGIRYTYCTECHEKIKYEEIAAGHDWNLAAPIATILDPKCNEEGLREYKCKHCDATTILPFSDNDHHTGTINTETIKAPTCTAEGVVKKTCDRCQTSWTEVVPAVATNHGWKKDAKLEDATCYTKKEKWTYYCEYCGARKTEDEDVSSDKWVHDYDEGVKHDPTCGTAGDITYTCQNTDCDNVKVVPLPATGNHRFEQTYTYDPDDEVFPNHHWYKCSVCGVKADVTEHTITNWVNDGTTHSGSCVCGYTVTDQAHVYEQENGENKIYTDDTHHWHKCSVCSAELDKAEHDFDDKKDETKHWKECSCGKIVDEAEHSYTISKSDDTDHWSECSCGAIANKEAHVFGEEYVTDDDNHWFECSCGKKKDVTAHNFDPMKDATHHWDECSVCHAKKGVTEHSFDQKYNKDQHWEECSLCGYETEKANHNKVAIMEAVEATCTNSGNSEGVKCEDCGLVFVPVEYYGMLSHDVIDAWISDGDGHYHACRNCATKLDFQSHDFPTDWTVNDKEHKKTCTVCGARSADSKTHVYPESSYINIDDEAGTAIGVCECGHQIDVTVTTWYEALGMIKVDGKYYYPVDGENVKNVFVRFTDGLRYFDNDGALVLTYTANGIYSMTFKKSITAADAEADRGVIDKAVLSCGGLLVDGKGEGTYYICNGEFAPNTLLTINGNVYYFDENAIMVTNKYVDIDEDGVYEYWFSENGKGYKLVDED